MMVAFLMMTSLGLTMMYGGSAVEIGVGLAFLLIGALGAAICQVRLENSIEKLQAAPNEKIAELALINAQQAERIEAQKHQIDDDDRLIAELFRDIQQIQSERDAWKLAAENGGWKPLIDPTTGPTAAEISE